jgi:hypothetical protein
LMKSVEVLKRWLNNYLPTATTISDISYLWFSFLFLMVALFWLNWSPQYDVQDFMAFNISRVFLRRKKNTMSELLTRLWPLKQPPY